MFRKRRFSMAERNVRRVFSNHFARVRVLDLGDDSERFAIENRRLGGVKFMLPKRRFSMLERNVR